MIQVHSSVYLAAACLILILPIDWLLSAVTAAAVHEGFHVLAVLLQGGRIRKIRISCSGCVIDCSELSDMAKLISSLAGPVGSLSLLCFHKIVPQIAVFGLIQGLYNLLPVLPLDGGRILEWLLMRIVPKQTSSILSGTKLVIGFACVWLFFRLSMDSSAGWLPGAAASMLVLRWIYEKFLANRMKSGYNRLKSFYEVKL